MGPNDDNTMIKISNRVLYSSSGTRLKSARNRNIAEPTDSIGRMDEEPGRDFSYKRRPASTKLGSLFLFVSAGELRSPILILAGRKIRAMGGFGSLTFCFRL